MNSYYELSPKTWEKFKSITRFKTVQKNEELVSIGDIPEYIYFVHNGLFRAFAIAQGDEGKEVNKYFFDEGRFPASIIASLQNTESNICIQALEDSKVISIHYPSYRKLLEECHDLKWYHISYLEKHWVIEKEPIEISLLDGEAKQRYNDFINKNPGMIERVPLYHIASRLGITPTQLSRIRNSLKK